MGFCGLGSRTPRTEGLRLDAGVPRLKPSDVGTANDPAHYEPWSSSRLNAALGLHAADRFASEFADTPYFDSIP
jgi:hypothetical protein